MAMSVGTLVINEGGMLKGIHVKPGVSWMTILGMWSIQRKKYGSAKIINMDKESIW